MTIKMTCSSGGLCCRKCTEIFTMYKYLNEWHQQYSKHFIWNGNFGLGHSKWLEDGRIIYLLSWKHSQDIICTLSYGNTQLLSLLTKTQCHHALEDVAHMPRRLMHTCSPALCTNHLLQLQWWRSTHQALQLFFFLYYWQQGAVYFQLSFSGHHLSSLPTCCSPLG